MDTFTAIADPTRRSIMELLAANGQLSATDISSRYSISPQAISQHLKILRETRVVDVEKRAQQRIYRMNPDALLEVEEWAKRYRNLWSRRFEALDAVLKREKERSAADSAAGPATKSIEGKDRNDDERV
ncbi:winged helix-turn-helix transcriptional regulator [Paenibacillus sp. MWE-103]|uniref:Winged helix-turn-helix transcriptional regulator n=1 Tax=Paenibacillus artemisiicola TaxID=1172618 RepID=A0ABS3WCV8_9BACL|nr:metalloregulator ArsR/SmtB family transcription factor [Paenibacillus artemisiicola]MBO7746112.1 winged helix-turn-helix transcriptional regulator [Paenibacillus artemisiicola]